MHLTSVIVNLSSSDDEAAACDGAYGKVSFENTIEIWFVFRQAIGIT